MSKEVQFQAFYGIVKKMKISKFIGYQCQITKVSQKYNFQLNLIQILQILLFSRSQERGKCAHLSRFVQSGVPPRQGNRKSSLALSNSDSQLFTPLQDTEAELGSESLGVNHQITAEGKYKLGKQNTQDLQNVS